MSPLEFAKTPCWVNVLTDQTHTGVPKACLAHAYKTCSKSKMTSSTYFHNALEQSWLKNPGDSKKNRLVKEIFPKPAAFSLGDPALAIIGVIDARGNARVCGGERCRFSRAPKKSSKV